LGKYLLFKDPWRTITGDYMERNLDFISQSEGFKKTYFRSTTDPAGFPRQSQKFSRMIPFRSSQ
jgi:hypothetical protein